VNYAYMPGCSSHSSSRDYEMSALAVLKALGVQLEEIKDWNCCGSTPVSSVAPVTSMALSARNLALAEEAGYREVVVTCSSCYSMLKRAETYYRNDPAAREMMAGALKTMGRQFEGMVTVKHILELMVYHLGPERLAAAVTKPLKDVKIVPYYGCLLGRPQKAFDDPETPTSMDEALRITGAEVLRFDRKSKCCGGSVMLTKQKAVLRLVEEILWEAADRGADVIAVACPLCQLNLDAYQTRVNAEFGTSYRIPVLYFTQVLGIAMGLDKKHLALGKTFVPAGRVVNI